MLRLPDERRRHGGEETADEHQDAEEDHGDGAAALQANASEGADDRIERDGEKGRREHENEDRPDEVDAVEQHADRSNRQRYPDDGRGRRPLAHRPTLRSAVTR